jgi:hypothetical protein
MSGMAANRTAATVRRRPAMRERLLRNGLKQKAPVANAAGAIIWKRSSSARASRPDYLPLCGLEPAP